jgi:hypothetical protein
LRYFSFLRFKQFLILGLTLIVFSNITFSQITVTNINTKVPCCKHSDSIDIDNNGSFDVKIISSGQIDAVGFDIFPLKSNIEHPNNPVDSGEFFPRYYSSGLIAQTSVGCQWGNTWKPNTGYKYIGFRRINSPNDTTYGWLKLDFRGSLTNCKDTIYGKTLGFSNTSNKRLFAGQTTFTAKINAQPSKNRMRIYPNPNSGSFKIENAEIGKEFLIEVIDQNGQILFKEQASTEFNLDLSNGIYFVKHISTEGVQIHKMILYK